MNLDPRLCLGVALAFLPLPTALAQIHVDPTGDDVMGDGSPGNPYQTISFAAGAASSGDTLVLAAGTYGDTEQIVLGSIDLQIIGAGIGQTIIKPHPTLTVSRDVGDPNGAPSVQDLRPAITVDGPSRVEVRGLTIDCDFRVPASGRLHGIAYLAGADGSVEDVEVVNCRTNPITGIQGPRAVIAYGTDLADPTVLTVRECLVHEWGKTGIVAYYNAQMTVEHCTVRGAGPLGTPNPAQNGIQLTFGATGTFRFNRVSGIRYTPSSTVACGILCFDPSAGAIVEGNDINDCEVGINFTQTTPGSVAAAIRGNSCTGAAEYGIEIDGQDGIVVENNVVHALLTSGVAAYDDSATGNVWSNNNYSDYTGVGPYAIAGGIATDAAPRTGCDEIGSPSAVALGGVPVEMVTLDLDGAHGPDAVTVNEGPTNSVSVALNDGTGNFTVTDLAFGNANGRPVAIAAGDFDGNGSTDIAVLTVNKPSATTENKVFVFSNTAGTLSLAHTEALPAAVVTPNDLAAADFDSDGSADLAIADLGALATAGAAFALANDGTGTAWTTTMLAGPFSTQVQGIAAADLDGSNGPDLAATEGNGSTGQVHLWTNDGAGNFAAHAASPVAVAINPNAIEAGDIDADGDNDLVVTAIGAAAPIDEGTATVLRNDLPTGFTSSETRTDRGPTAIAIGDLLDDDDPDTLRRDAAVVNFAGRSVKLLTAFDGTTFAGGPQCALGGTPRDVALADVDGDGLSDVLVVDAASQSLLVHLGRATAFAVLYGQGCPGTDSRIPQIRAVGAPAVPNQPNATFGVACSNALPFAPAILNTSFTPGVALGPCNLLLGNIDVTFLTVADVFGESGVRIPIPAGPPSLEGLSLYFQWAILDPDGEFLDLVSLSNALQIRVGN